MVSANRTVVENFVNSLRVAGLEPSLSRNPLWHAVPKTFVVDLLRSFDVHPMNISFQATELAEYRFEGETARR